jgi:hypothetical protein
MSSLASNLAASSRIKSRVLKPIHLNQVKEDRKCGNVEEENEKDVEKPMKKKNSEKRRMKNEAQNNYHASEFCYSSPKLQSLVDCRLPYERTISLPDPNEETGIRPSTASHFPTSQRNQMNTRYKYVG